MAARKGIYQFEFDNSYSWINRKKIKVDKLVLMPLEFSSTDNLSWWHSYYENVPLNQLSDKTKLFMVSKKAHPKPVVQHEGEGNITKDGSFFNMKITRGKNIYEF
ncbi:MAG: hypothetical protein KDD45_12810 [Bdellovibrionales bacterium]|nr:hypothetical protein [Bdellovibrionales bacterium]